MKQHLLNRIDFIQKNAPSDKSMSPHFKSVYSRQAHMISPGGGNKQNFHPSSKSSNMSMSKKESDELSAPRRFIMQGLALTTSQIDKNSNNMEKDISPVEKYKANREKLRNMGMNKYVGNFISNNSRNDEVEKPVPKAKAVSMMDKNSL